MKLYHLTKVHFDNYIMTLRNQFIFNIEINFQS